MILDYLQIPFEYNQLLRILKTQHFGSFFRNLQYLESLGAYIQIDLGEITTLQSVLESGLPIIAYVDTGELTGYWNESTNHAVVVIGIDNEQITLNDPFFPDAPKHVSLDEFDLAWDAQKRLYAVISLMPYELEP